MVESLVTTTETEVRLFTYASVECADALTGVAVVLGEGFHAGLVEVGVDDVEVAQFVVVHGSAHAHVDGRLATPATSERGA